MASRVVDQHIDMWQREIVLRTGLVQIPIVDAHADPTIFLGHGDNIGHPLGIIGYFYEAGVDLFDDLFFDFEDQIGALPP